MNKSPQVIAISSGKGGVGKTFFSVHLAARATQLGKRVLLLDADLGLANVDVMLALEAKGSIAQVIDGQLTLSDILVRYGEDFDVLPGGSGLHELTRLSPRQQGVLLDEMDELSKNYDLILVDTAAGIGENVMFFASSSESNLIILTPDPTSLTDAYALIKVLSNEHGVRRFMVAINQADEVTAQMIFNRLMSVSDRYLDVILEPVGFMSESPEVRKTIQSQALFYARAPQADIEILNKVIDTILSHPRNKSGGGLKFSWQRSLSDGLDLSQQENAVI
ncbi:MAG: AAA family ATPase [Mariprofundaceae bacterium]